MPVPIAAVRGKWLTSALTTLIYDTFTAADGTAVNGRTPSPTSCGTTWVGVNSPKINDNSVKRAGTELNRFIWIDSGKVAMTQEYDRVNPDTSFWGDGSLLRVIDQTNYFGVYLRNAALFSILENTGGSLTQRASTACVYTAGESCHMKVVDDGTVITGTVTGLAAGTKVVTYSSTEKNTNKKQGVFLYTDGIVDNYMVVG